MKKAKFYINDKFLSPSKSREVGSSYNTSKAEAFAK